VRTINALLPLALALVAPGAGAGTIFLCKAYSGGMFWSQSHCNQHKALIERIASVPDGLPFQHQVSLAQQQQAAAQVPPDVQYSVPAPPPAPDRAAQCRNLEPRFKRLDGRARYPQTTTSRDAIRMEKDHLSEQQAALGC
jgi:hypothetical protein